MPRKKASKKKAVAKKKSTEVISWQDKLAALAEEESERSTVIGGGNNTIRLSKGAFKFQGEDLGDSIEVVVVDSVKHKSYYDRPFDEDNPSPPACFALDPKGKNMVPHETSPDRQADECVNCWANEFESDNRGRGKACRTSYMLAVIASNQLDEAEPDVAYVRVPPTSLAAWDSYIVKRNKVMHLPSLAFVTQISMDDESEYQKLLFDEVGRTPEEAFPSLFELRDTVREIMMTPPDVSNYEPPGAKKKGRKKPAKKKKVAKKKAKSKSRF